MQKHFDLLGWKVKDAVTGFTGTVTHVGLDLYGCIQALVTPAVVVEKSGVQKVDDTRWFDTARLEKVGKTPVMKPIPVKGDLVVAGADNSKPLK